MASNTSIRHEDGHHVRTDSLTEAYFLWLVEKVQEDNRPRKTYWDLFAILFTTEFVWIILPYWK
jgi:hypothetical protein